MASKNTKKKVAKKTAKKATKKAVKKTAKKKEPVIEFPKPLPAQDTEDRMIRNAQYRKGLSIAFFNATNAAVELVKTTNPEASEKESQKLIVQWRNFFLKEHRDYYASVIEQVGLNYSIEDAVKKIKATKSLTDLQKVWLSFTEDERRDPEISEAAQAKKKSL